MTDRRSTTSCGYLDDFLRIPDIPDERTRSTDSRSRTAARSGGIVAAVDASQETIEGDRAGPTAALLLVHHGLFWDGNVPLTGRRYRRVTALLEQDAALYAAHIPLDLHPEVGNNVELARGSASRSRGSATTAACALGVWGTPPRDIATRDALVAEVNRALRSSRRGRSDPGRPRAGQPGGDRNRRGRVHDRCRAGHRTRYLHHWRGTAPHLLRRGRVGPQRDLRGPLRNRDAGRPGAGSPWRTSSGSTGSSTSTPPACERATRSRAPPEHREAIRPRACPARGRFHTRRPAKCTRCWARTARARPR